METIDEIASEWSKNLGSFDKSSKLSSRAQKGDLQALNRYSALLGLSLQEVFKKILKSLEFSGLSNKDKAEVVRYILGDLIRNSNDVTRSLSFESMNSVLKNRGLLFNAEIGEVPDDRIKAIIAGSLKFIINEDDLEAGRNVLNAGAQQMVDNGVRDTIIKTSDKVFRNTGMRLEGRRLVTGKNPCKFCKDLASRPFTIKAEMEEAHFHDFCDCMLVIE